MKTDVTYNGVNYIVVTYGENGRFRTLMANEDKQEFLFDVITYNEFQATSRHKSIVKNIDMYVKIYEKEGKGNMIIVKGINEIDEKRYKILEKNPDMRKRLESEGFEFVKKEEKKYMKGWEAIKELQNGKAIRRKGWGNKSYRIILDGLGRMRTVDNNGLNIWTEKLNDKEILATDWEIYEENKCKNCQWRFKLQTNDIMCCKHAKDTTDESYCNEFEYNKVSDDYVKKLNELFKVIKETKEDE